MTVKKLRKLLKKFPGNMSVMIPDAERDFYWIPLESVGTKKIKWKEDSSDKKALAVERCVVLK